METLSHSVSSEMSQGRDSRVCCAPSPWAQGERASFLGCSLMFSRLSCGEHSENSGSDQLGTPVSNLAGSRGGLVWFLFERKSFSQMRTGGLTAV